MSTPPTRRDYNRTTLLALEVIQAMLLFIREHYDDVSST